MSAADVLTLIDAAPSFSEPTPPQVDLRRYGLSQLNLHLALIREADGEGRLPAVQKAGEELARLVAVDAIAEPLIRGALDKAALDFGLLREIGGKTVKKVIADAIKLGKKQPRDLDHVRREATALSRPRPAAVHIPSSPDTELDAGAVEAAQIESVGLSPSFSVSSPRSPLGEENDPQTLANDDDGDRKPPDESITEETFRYCASLDHSDVDNGKRLLAYFGNDILVRQEDDVEAGQMLAWTGTHWDLSGGTAGARLVAQRVGDLIKLEADFIEFTPSEERAIREGEAAAKELKDIDTDSDKPETRAAVAHLNELVKTAKKARSARSSRRAYHRKWGVGSKNAGRISNMLKEAAPHLRRHPDAFNADPLKVATLTHTLAFVPIDDPDNPDPDGKRPLIVEGRVQYRLVAKRGHDRGDMLTAVIPYAYDPKAFAREFNVFLDLFQPEPKKRRTIQQFSGMSLTSQPVQRVMYHTGTGGNGKSVYLEVLARVFGDGLSVGLPAESVSGQVQNNPSAPTPDIARCYAKRYMRIAELPKDAPLKMETIKKLTGGERWPVRTMYKGYFEFKPTGKPHMSGNGEPKFDGSDGGMKRRLAIVEWSVTLPTEKHRDFEDVVTEIVAGGSGILNWLIEGALDFLNNGFILSDDVLKTTADHFAEMDPCGQFIAAHVRPDPGGPGVTGRAMYVAYKAWCEVNGMAKMFETRFGLTMKKKLTRDDTKRVHVYVDVALHELPQTEGQPPPHEHPPNEGMEHEPF